MSHFLRTIANYKQIEGHKVRHYRPSALGNMVGTFPFWLREMWIRICNWGFLLLLLLLLGSWTALDTLHYTIGQTWSRARLLTFGCCAVPPMFTVYKGLQLLLVGRGYNHFFWSVPKLHKLVPLLLGAIKNRSHIGLPKACFNFLQLKL